MFTDAEYGSINFDAITNYFKTNYSYVENHSVAVIGFGNSYYVGDTEDGLVKVENNETICPRQISS